MHTTTVKIKRTNNDLQNTTQNYRLSNANLFKKGGELWYSGRVRRVGM